MGIKNSNENYVIMSAERANLGIRENIQRTEELQDVLETMGFNYVRAGGLWDSTREVSLIVELNDYTSDLNKLMELAASFEQEAILELKQGHGWMHFTTGQRGEYYAGRIKQVVGREVNDYTELSNGYRFRVSHI